MNKHKSFQKSLNQKKGVAGIEIAQAVMIALLGLVLTAFLIVIISDKLLVQSGTARTSDITILGESLGVVTNSSVSSFAVSGNNGVICTILAIHNGTAVLIPSSNYTQSNCGVQAIAGSPFQGKTWTANYTYTYLAETKAGSLFNETITETADNTTDNIGLIIFLGFLVVIVILVSIALFYLSRVGGSGSDPMVGGREGA